MPVEEDVVLASADPPVSHAFTLELKSLQPRLYADGSVQLVDGEKVVGSIPAGFMNEAVDTRSDDGRCGLDKIDDDTWTLSVELNKAWLRDPARVFPVVVDRPWRIPSCPPMTRAGLRAGIRER
ncbi:hypothetical protein OG205_28820 [Lentzea sp. NBC_00516]|uniref:hypothetical protein n=1 Tax=Lentzea sp. NBC_00516 TaxID=2903582 RepID=UPI002E80683F|nr:hypothetical protein [Lentzea sp. NBC_00516]WUD22089.1 hypothetical protein OG205_28820 [Lentzea sp. NBC_00516]